MGFDAKQQALEQRMDAQWAARKATCPLLFENTKQVPPENLPFVRMSVRFGKSQKADLTNRYRHPGAVMCQIFVPVQGGVRSATALVDAVAAVWRGVQVSGITLRAPEVVHVPDRGDGWFQVNVITDFFWDETF